MPQLQVPDMTTRLVLGKIWGESQATPDGQGTCRAKVYYRVEESKVLWVWY